MMNNNITYINEWKETSLLLNSDIGQAVRILNEIGLKLVLVIDEKDSLIGTISDGDIRRGMMRGLTFSSAIESIVNREPLVVPPDLDKNIVIQLMIVNRIQQVPIVDEKGRVVGLHIWEYINSTPERRNMMIIMAGGIGSRLLPYTKDLPKPMLLIGGKPILEHIILNAKAEGFFKFVITIHYLGHIIEQYFGNGEKLGVKIDYIREEYPHGTAGAIKYINPKPSNAFVVTNGDVLTNINYGRLLDFHVNSNAEATMAIRSYEWKNPFGVVETDGLRITNYQEKPTSLCYINAGVYVLQPSVIELVNKFEHIDMPNIFKQFLINNEKVIAFPIHENWEDIGRPIDLEKANFDFNNRSN